jgi:hypothetical protein
MQELKQLNVRLPSELYDRIIKSGRSRKDITIDAFKLYFDVNKHNQQHDPQQNDKAAYALMAEQLQTKDIQISKLHNEISELHILLQTTLNQNMITAPEKDDKRPWWKIW